MRPNYTELDTMIIVALRAGESWLHSHSVRFAAMKHSDRLRDIGIWRHHSEITRARLQALRKAGRIKHDKATPAGPGGWRVVDA